MAEELAPLDGAGLVNPFCLGAMPAGGRPDVRSRGIKSGVRPLGRRASLWWLLPLASLLVACTAPAVRTYQETAQGFGFSAGQVSGRQFSHRVYRNRAAQRPGPRRLHVYLDGDGSPWRGRGRPALDPTPHNPLMLRLMAQDSRPAVYLARPCHAGLRDPAICHPWYWTHGRYSEAVVTSMAAALAKLIADQGVHETVLIGYSGGGTLAMLLAPRLESVTDVVTLAANLDVRAWAEHHAYSPLSGSLDPARQGPLAGHIRQWHWVGSDDRRVPPRLVAQGLAGQAVTRFEIIPQLDHACCWEGQWPRLLGIVTAAADGGGG